MKLDQLVAKSERMRKLNSNLVKIVGYKTGFDKKGVPTAICKSYTPKEYIIGNRIVNARDKNRYTTSIKFIDKKLNVKVSCSCPDFTFAGYEWVLAQLGAADIIYGNGDPPDVRNASHKPGLCKHLLALRKVLKQRNGV